MIYFIQNGDRAGHIKIGHVNAIGLKTRRRALQIGSPYVLKIIGVMAGWRKTENYLHSIYRAHKAQGEWFEPIPELLSYIERHASQRVTPELIALDIAQCRLEGKQPRPYTAPIR